MVSKRIIICGDAPLQLFLCPEPIANLAVPISPRYHTHWSRGGSALLAALSERFVTSVADTELISPEFTNPSNDSIEWIVELNQKTPKDQQGASYSVESVQRLDCGPKWHAVEPYPVEERTDIYVLQDAGKDSTFTDNGIDAAVRYFTKARPRYLVYHMSRPLCSGGLWEDLRHGPYISQTERDPERVIVVVTADDLRAGGISLSYGLSWERTCDDFVKMLGSVGDLVSLATCAHLIVLFGCDGAIYHRGLQAAKPILFFDPLCAEGELYRRNMGHLPGIEEAFVAGFLKGLVSSSSLSPEDAIKPALWAARRLARKGLQLEGDHESQTRLYHASALVDQLGNAEDGQLLKFSVPSREIASANDLSWSLIDEIIGDPAEIARRIVREGVESLASQIPIARFDDLVLFDRQEVESFRALFNFVKEYISGPQKTPLKVVVCGPKNSGKHFVVLKVVQSAVGSRQTRQMRFNLPQFTYIDLLAALHCVRDCILEGYTPIVYFSGFDTDLSGTQLGWIPHLLPLVLEGTFLDQGISRPIGPAIFFFGATQIMDCDELQQRATAAATMQCRLQDFVGCLDAFVTVLGPDRVESRHSTDVFYPVRRAVVLRSLLEERLPTLKSGKSIEVDEGVLNGLLLVPHYRQGIQSLKSIIAMTVFHEGEKLNRSALPPPPQLDLHVDYQTFMQHMGGVPIPDHLREDLAKRLHGEYLNARRKMSLSEQERNDLKQWDDLPQELKESSRAHADSVPQKLSLISCFLSNEQVGRVPIERFSEEEIEILAKNEHDRWNCERLQKQWHLGERALADRSSPFLKPWVDIPPDWKDVDRAIVASYPRILRPYKIYRMSRA
jgi:hypothetical protein